MRPGERFETRVVRSRRLTPTTHGIDVEKPAGFTFQPTQFTFLQLETPEDVAVRPMSLATSPTRPHLEYGVRVSDSAFKHAFAALQPGDTVVVQGVYSNRTVEEIVYREELDVLERSNPNFQVLYTLTRGVPGSWEGRTGRIGVGADLLTDAAAGLDRPVYYLCGAPGFIEACFRSLVSSGVAEADIRFEIFRGYGATA